MSTRIFRFYDDGVGYVFLTFDEIEMRMPKEDGISKKIDRLELIITLVVQTLRRKSAKVQQSAIAGWRMQRF